MRSFVLPVIAVLALSACSSEPPVVVKWSKPGASYDAFVAVHARCMRAVESQDGSYFLAGERYPGPPTTMGGIVADAGKPLGIADPRPDVRPSLSLFTSCMNAQGYMRDPKGYALPPDDQTAMGF